MTVFSITIGVYNNANTIIESTNGQFYISLTSSTSGIFSGITSGTTSSGQITFTNLRILSSGTQTIIAQSTGITSISSVSLSITNYVYTISSVSSTYTPTAYFSFTITVTLKGEDNNLFTGTSTTALTCTSSISGTTSLGNSGGIAVFTIYFTSLGSQVITITSSSTTSTVSLYVLPEILKITSFTPVLFM